MLPGGPAQIQGQLQNPGLTPDVHFCMWEATSTPRFTSCAKELHEKVEAKSKSILLLAQKVVPALCSSRENGN